MLKRTLIALALMAGSSVSPAQAQPQAATTWPQKPVRLLVGFAAGGNTDTVARVLAARMQELVGHPVVVENRAGAGGVIATEMVAKALPDGHTLLMSSLGPHTVSPSLLKSVGFDPVADLAPVSNIAENALVLMVNNALPVRSVRDLVAWEKSHAGQLSFGSSGVASTTHLSGEVFNRMTGTRMVHVAYRGGALAIVGLIGGDIQVMFANLSDALPQIAAGKVRAIAVTSPHRVPQLPDLPSVADSGLPGFDVSPWNGLVAPGRTPPEVIARIAEVAQRIVRETAFRERMIEIGSQPVGDTPEQFRATIANDIQRWSRIVREAGIKAE